MKKINIFWVIALVLPLLFTLNGCAPEEKDDPPPSVKKMIFEKDTVRFTIKSNFEFEAVFLAEVEVLTGMAFKENERVWGSFTNRETETGSKAKWDKDFSGTAKIKGADTVNAALKTQAPSQEIPIKVTYTKESGDITALNLEMVGTSIGATIGGPMMGGDYTRKK